MTPTAYVDGCVCCCTFQVWASFHPGGSELDETKKEELGRGLLKHIGHRGRIDFEEFAAWFKSVVVRVQCMWGAIGTFLGVAFARSLVGWTCACVVVGVLFFRRKTCKSISDFRRKQAEQKKAEEKAAEEAAHRAAMEREGVKQNKARRTNAPHAHAPRRFAEDVCCSTRALSR